MDRLWSSATAVHIFMSSATAISVTYFGQASAGLIRFTRFTKAFPEYLRYSTTTCFVCYQTISCFTTSDIDRLSLRRQRLNLPMRLRVWDSLTAISVLSSDSAFTGPIRCDLCNFMIRLVSLLRWDSGEWFALRSSSQSPDMRSRSPTGYSR